MNVISCDSDSDIEFRRMVPCRPANIVLWGDSFFERLYEEIPRWGSKFDRVFGQSPAKAKVSWACRPGAHVEDLEKGIRGILTRRKPDILVVQVGSNDMCTAEPLNTAVRISEVLDMAKDSGCQQVVTVQVLHRRRRGVKDHNDPIMVYNRRVDQLNQCNRDFMEATPGGFYWQLSKALSGRNCRPLAKDGIHLERVTKLKEYYRNMKGAVLKAMKAFSGMVS